MVVLARQNGQLKKEIKKWKKDFQKPISDWFQPPDWPMPYIHWHIHTYTASHHTSMAGVHTGHWAGKPPWLLDGTYRLRLRSGGSGSDITCPRSGSGISGSDAGYYRIFCLQKKKNLAGISDVIMTHVCVLQRTFFWSLVHHPSQYLHSIDFPLPTSHINFS
jgi:hypothetical protein